MNTSDARNSVPCCRIPVFETSSQDDVKEFGAHNPEADGSSVFCNKQYQLLEVLTIWTLDKMRVVLCMVTMKNVSLQEPVKGSMT